MNPENSHDFDINSRDDHDACWAIFYQQPKLDGKATAQEGRPVHKMVDMVEIHVPGDRDILHVEVRDEDKARFPKAYAKFLKNQEQTADGTALESWPPIDRATVADFKYMNIRTVEDLANLSDDKLQKLGPGARQWQNKAQLYLEAAAGDAPMYRLEQEKERLQAQIDTLTETVGNLKSRLDEKPEKRGPGRPKKDAA